MPYKNVLVLTAHALRRYLKYLTKKFLKKHNVRDWLRVIASNKDRKCALWPFHLHPRNACACLMGQMLILLHFLLQCVRVAVLQHCGQRGRGGGLSAMRLA